MSVPGNSLNSVRIPVQRNGFRYIPARSIPTSQSPSTSSPPAAAYEEDHWQDRVTLSLHDRSREVELDWCQSRLIAWGGPFGYRSIMATHGANQFGSYYYELEVRRVEESGDPHVRLGLARMGASLLGPVGMDAFGYGFTESGFAVHEAKKLIVPDADGQALVFKQGDRVGCSIVIKPRDDVLFPPTEPKYRLVEYFRTYFETVIPREPADIPLMDADMRFYVNGRPCAEPVVTSLPLAVYYPMISVYRGARVRFIPDAADMAFLPEGFQPWAALFTSRRIEYKDAPMPVLSQLGEGNAERFADEAKADSVLVDQSTEMVPEPHEMQSEPRSLPAPLSA